MLQLASEGKDEADRIRAAEGIAVPILGVGPAPVAVGAPGVLLPPAGAGGGAAVLAAPVAGPAGPVAAAALAAVPAPAVAAPA
eukprot:2625877-Karenia_brevis.AAC.1